MYFVFTAAASIYNLARQQADVSAGLIYFRMQWSRSVATQRATGFFAKRRLDRIIFKKITTTKRMWNFEFAVDCSSQCKVYKRRN